MVRAIESEQATEGVEGIMRMRVASSNVVRARAIALTAGMFAMLTAAKCPFRDDGSSANANRPIAARGDSAEQVVYGARVLLAQQNVSKGLLTATTARLYAGGSRLEMDGVVFTFYDTAGVKSGLLSGQSGTYLVKSGQLDVRGKASVVREDGRKLESEHIVFDHARSTISANGAFVYSDRPGAPRITGNLFESDARLRRAARSSPATSPKSTPPR